MYLWNRFSFDFEEWRTSSNFVMENESVSYFSKQAETSILSRVISRKKCLQNSRDDARTLETRFDLKIVKGSGRNMSLICQNRSKCLGERENLLVGVITTKLVAMLTEKRFELFPSSYPSFLSLFLSFFFVTQRHKTG